MIDIERQIPDIITDLTTQIQGGQLCVYFQDEMVIDWCFGNTGKPYNKPIDMNALFDVASLTKLIVFSGKSH